MSASPIAAMFDRISPKYDALNHLLSFNIDKVWRQKTAKTVTKSQPKTNRLKAFAANTIT